MNTNTPVPSWKVEFDARIKAFSEACKVSESQVRKVLSDLGVDGESEQSLNMIDSDEILPMGDLRAAFVDRRDDRGVTVPGEGLTKIALLRLAMPHLRGKTHLAQPDSSANVGFGDVVSTIKDMVAANRPKSEWSLKELVDRYSEDETEIIKILREKSHGRYFVVFNSDGQVNKEVTLDLLRVAMKQNTTDRHLVNGRLVKVRRAGEFLVNLVEESPFCRGTSLVQGVCGTSGTDWNGISTENRILARIQVNHVERVQLSNSELRRIWADAKGSAADFREKYPEAAIKYDELALKDELPKLKVDPRNSSTTTGKVDNGF